MFTMSILCITDVCPAGDPCKCSFTPCDSISGYAYCDPAKCADARECPYCCCKTEGELDTFSCRINIRVHNLPRKRNATTVSGKCWL